MPIICTCQNCHKEFPMKPYAVKRGHGKFCSKACVAIGRQKQLPLTCVHCRVSFFRTPSEVAYGKIKYCSLDCYHSAQKAMYQSELPFRFWNRVQKTDTCWIWMGKRFASGYGSIGNGQSAHRFSWELHNGPIPDDLHVLHQCDNRPCVNPDHLFLGTQQANVADMMAKGRHRSLAGEKAWKARLTEADVRAIRLLYQTGDWTQAALGSRFQVSRTTISGILRGVIWKHLS